MQFNTNPEWLQQMADAEDNCDVTVGSEFDAPLRPEFILDLNTLQSASPDEPTFLDIQSWHFPPALAGPC